MALTVAEPAVDKSAVDYLRRMLVAMLGSSAWRLRMALSQRVVLAPR